MTCYLDICFNLRKQIWLPEPCVLWTSRFLEKSKVLLNSFLSFIGPSLSIKYLVIANLPLGF